MTRRSRRSGFSLIEMMVVIVIIAILIALTIGAVQRARTAAAKVYCVNNLAQMGIALKSFESLNGAFPPGTNPYPPLGSPTSVNPNATNPYYTQGWIVALTSYLGVNGTNLRSHNGMLYGLSCIRPCDVLDGLSTTIMVGERPPNTGHVVQLVV
jgi:prepilin-type N-terminal cleavage/methylation domain-containing protein